MKRIVLVIGLILVAANALCMDDSPSNRMIEAERYLAATPPQDLFEDMAEQMANNLAPSEELSALADFYGSEVGKSAMKKFGTYMADVMPSIDAEMTKAYTEVSRELEGQSQ